MPKTWQSIRKFRIDKCPIALSANFLGHRSDNKNKTRKASQFEEAMTIS